VRGVRQNSVASGRGARHARRLQRASTVASALAQTQHLSKCAAFGDKHADKSLASLASLGPARGGCWSERGPASYCTRRSGVGQACKRACQGKAGRPDSVRPCAGPYGHGYASTVGYMTKSQGERKCNVSARRTPFVSAPARCARARCAWRLQKTARVFKNPSDCASSLRLCHRGTVREGLRVPEPCRGQ
jgi:hypothetical protein